MNLFDILYTIQYTGDAKSVNSEMRPVILIFRLPVPGPVDIA